MKKFSFFLLTLAVLCAAGQTSYASDLSTDIDQLLKPAKGTLKAYAGRATASSKDVDKARVALTAKFQQVKNGPQPPAREDRQALLELNVQFQEMGRRYSAMRAQLSQYQGITMRRFFGRIDELGIRDKPSLIPEAEKKLSELKKWMDELESSIPEQKFKDNMALADEVMAYIKQFPME